MAMAVILGHPVHRHHVPRLELPHPADRAPEADRHRPDRGDHLRRRLVRVLPVPGVHRPAAVPGREHLVRRVPAARRRPRRGRLLPAPVRVPGRPARLLDRDHHPGTIAALAGRHRRRRHPRPDPAVRGRRVHRLHDQPVGHGQALAAQAAHRAGGTGSRSTRPARCDRRDRGRRHVRQVRRRRVPRRAADPILVGIMLFIRRQYDGQATELARPGRPRVRAAAAGSSGWSSPVNGINRAVVQAVMFGGAVSDPSSRPCSSPTTSRRASELRTRWERQLPGVPLVVVESPYRALVGPVVTYLDVLEQAWPPDKEAPTTIVVLPEYVARHWWDRLLYNQARQAPEAGARRPRAHGHRRRPVPAGAPTERAADAPRLVSGRPTRVRAAPDERARWYRDPARRRLGA